MKKSIVSLLCMIMTIIAFGQVHKQVLEQVEVTPPKFTGIEGVVTIIQNESIETIDDYLIKNIEYPEESVQRWLEGTAIVQFVVTANGEVTNFEVINSVTSDIDDELIRVLETTNGMWKPGLNNGRPVAMEKEVSVSFKMAETTDFVTMATKYFEQGNKRMLIKSNPKRALKYYDRGIGLLPNEKCFLLARGMCRYELGNEDGACEDWNKIKALGGVEADYQLDNFCEMKGYAELIRMLDEE